MRNYQKGQHIEAMVLSIDPERERISLGIKQLAKDPFSGYMAEQPEGQHRHAASSRKWTRVARSSTWAMASRASCAPPSSAVTASRTRAPMLKVGDEIEAKFIGVDRKTRSITLSIKAKEMHEEAEAVQSYRTETGSGSSGTSLGDLLKEQIGRSSATECRAMAAACARTWRARLPA